MKIGDFPLTIPSCFCPSFMTVHLTVITPAISIAPQNEISPSPSVLFFSPRTLLFGQMGGGDVREKCKSPTLNFAPGTCTGKYTLLPLDKFFISQLPPCSGLPGTVRAPSAAIFAAVASSAAPACAFVVRGGFATVRVVPLAAFSVINSASRRFHSAKISAEGAQPRIPG